MSNENISEVCTKLRIDYDKLLSSGMFWEIYPNLSGDYNKDVNYFIKHQIKEIKFRESINKSLPEDKNILITLKQLIENNE